MFSHSTLVPGFGVVGFCAAVALLGSACGDDTSSAGGGGSGGDLSAGGTTSDGGGGSGAELSVETYASDPAIFALDSYLVTGPTEALLIDAQFFRVDAEAVVAMIERSGKTLTTVLVTHAHPDHYLGLELVKDAFPDARFVTTAAVLADYQARAQGTLDALKPQLGDAIADSIVTLEALDGESISVDGIAVEVVNLEGGEAPHTAMLSVPSLDTLFAGDLLYNDAHLVLSECDSEAWKTNVEAIRGLGYSKLYPGHGAPTDASVLDEVVAYIDVAVPAMDEATTTDDAKAAILDVYPDLEGAGLLDFSVTNYFANCKSR